MQRAHAKRPNTRFVQPPSILAISIDPATGLLAGPGQLDARMEEFLPGTEPTQIAPAPEAPEELPPTEDEPARAGERRFDEAPPF